MEAIFEFRFEAAVPNAGDLLPGLLYAELRSEYPEVQPLPVATIPRELREKEPNLRYLGTQRLTGGQRAVQVGDRVVTLSVVAPYPGWASLKAATAQLLSTLGRLKIVREPERFSFRYINVIPGQPEQPQLPLLNLQMAWADRPFIERGFQLRFEHDEFGFTTIVQIGSQTTAKSAATGTLVSGLLVDVDTISGKPAPNFWEADATTLDDAHSVLKRTFFSLLTESTLEGLGPVW